MSDVSKNKHDDDTGQSELSRATQATIMGMQHTAHTLANASHLSPIEIDAMVRDVADLVPAGNIPTMILSGLSRIQQNQTPPEEKTKRDVHLIFRGMGQMLDEASYRLLVHVPARAILAYQKMLKLAGRNLDDAFPDGTWQFYVDYALREDTARHTNETDGFDSILADHNIVLDDVDRMTAWAMAAIYSLHQYDTIIKNQWRERVYIRKLIEVTAGTDLELKFAKLWQTWMNVVPYRRMADARGDEVYSEYRSKRFDAFLFEYISQVPANLKRDWMLQIQQAKQEQLAKYQKQMSILGYLEPESNSETHKPFSNLMGIHIGLVYSGHYFLLPICEPKQATPPSVDTIRALIAAMTRTQLPQPPTDLTRFATIKRWQWPNIKKQLPKDFVRDLDLLKTAPIILNFDPRNKATTLSEIRQAERGIGDHALTIFDTRKSQCFDLSHIYFDGTWGAAFAEIMTNEALSWAKHLQHKPAAKPAKKAPLHLPFASNKKVYRIAEQAEHTSPEVGAENDQIAIKSIVQLRRFFKMRSDLLNLTVNDLLVLYRAIHSFTYKPSQKLVANLEAMQRDSYLKETATVALNTIQKSERSPATLIPIDASLKAPRERLYPMTFEVPLEELNLLDLHQQVVAALMDLERGRGKEPFNRLQREYLAALADFGQVMTVAKQIATAGESTSIKSIKMLAHLPTPFQRLLDAIPEQWDVLNDIIKGREVFSNIGQVAKLSTLRRFTSAKDDNEKKTLAWGVLTDADDMLRITLRDFRPHVALLIAHGQATIAQHITQDYLDAYARGFNDYIRDLIYITRKSPETTLNMRAVE